jgi:outer membrane biosynthesis protein TonB
MRPLFSGTMCPVEDTASETVIAQRGWPSAEAIAAAVASHGAVIAWLIAHPVAAAPREERTALSVALVAPPPDPVSPAETAQPSELAAPVVPDADTPKRLGKPRSQSAPSHPKRRPQKPNEDESAGVYSSEGTQELPQGTAAYRVLVGNGGMIESIALMRSSGVAAYDAAGETMIRNSMTFDPPPVRSSDTVATIVTISFSPKQ